MSMSSASTSKRGQSFSSSFVRGAKTASADCEVELVLEVEDTVLDDA